MPANQTKTVPKLRRNARQTVSIFGSKKGGPAPQKRVRARGKKLMSALTVAAASVGTASSAGVESTAAATRTARGALTASAAAARGRSGALADYRRCNPNGLWRLVIGGGRRGVRPVIRSTRLPAILCGRPVGIPGAHIRPGRRARLTESLPTARAASRRFIGTRGLGIGGFVWRLGRRRAGRGRTGSGTAPSSGDGRSGCGW